MQETHNQSTFDPITYWKTRGNTGENGQDIYRSAPMDRTYYLYDLIAHKIKLPYDASICELGCNVGRNLKYLSMQGYRQLHGVEVNELAIRETRSEVSNIHTYNMSIERFYEPFVARQFDCVFTMAVLEHLPYTSNDVFREIALQTDVMITIEDELTRSERHFPRNYEKVFTELGMEAIFHEHPLKLELIHDGFHARVFARHPSRIPEM